MLSKRKQTIIEATLVGTLAVGLLIGLLIGPAVAQPDMEDLTVAAMCQAGLSNSAIEYVQARRRLVAEDPSQSARWTMRLMECHAGAALHERSQSAAHWEECEQVLREFVAQQPSNNRLPWLQWQRARCDLLHTQADVALYLAAPANTQPRELALQRVRKMLADLDELEDEVKRMQPLAAREGLNGGELAPAAELAKLSVDVGLMRCEALLLRARMYASGSPDRIASATDVDRQVTDILGRTELAWPSRAQLSVAQAAARLELGQSAGALRALEQLAATANQRLARIRAATVAIEYCATIAADQSSNGSASLSRGMGLLELLKRNDAGPELALAEIQLSLAAAQRQQGQAREESLNALIAKSKNLGAAYGDYWRSRAESLLVGSVTSSGASGGSSVAFDLLIAEVRQLLAAGNASAAIEKLLRYRDNEVAAGRGASALKVASQAAALLQREQAYLPAADAVVAVCRQFVQEPGAAESHLQAIFCVSQALRGDATSKVLQASYEELLISHLELWPSTGSSDEVADWLASWLIARGRRHELAAAYLRRSLATTDVSIAEHSLLSWLGEVLSLRDAHLIVQQIEACTAARGARSLEHVATQAELVALVAKIASAWPTPTQQAEQLRSLARLETSPMTSTMRELVNVVRWLSVLRARQPMGSLSQTLLDWEPEQLPATIREGIAPPLIAAIDELPPAEHADWAKRLKLDNQWRDLLLKSGNAPSRAASYRLLAWSGDLSAALVGLKKLAEQQGRGGGDLQLELANALAEGGVERCEESSQIATIIIANSPAGSELHWQARWRWMKNQLLLGNAIEAQRSARLLLATQPPDNEIWKKRFIEIAE